MLAALGGGEDPGLPAALRAAVAARAADWAARVAAPGRAWVSDRVAVAQDAGLASFAEPADPRELPAALATLLTGHDGPVLLVAPDVPRLDDGLSAAALEDLAAGASVAFAPATDSRPFLLALADASPGRLGLLAGAGRDRDAVFSAAIELGEEVGLLRSERRVVTPGDARALAADPLVLPELRALAAG